NALVAGHDVALARTAAAHDVEAGAVVDVDAIGQVGQTGVGRWGQPDQVVADEIRVAAAVPDADAVATVAGDHVARVVAGVADQVIARAVLDVDAVSVRRRVGVA